MPTELVGAATTVQAGPAAGIGATAMLLAATPSGFRGQVAVDIKAGSSAGGIVAVTFGNRSGDGPFRASLTPASGVLQAGNLEDPILRPVAVTMLPAPAVAFGLVPIAVMDAGRMVGFRIFVTIALPAIPHYFAWAVI
jgi:hypothetical protein